MTRTQISAVFPPDSLLYTADRAGLTGLPPRAIVRFLGFLAAGYTIDEARNKVLPQSKPLSVFDGIAKQQTDFPEDDLRKIQAKYPGKTVSWALRFHMAIVNGATERQAANLADGYRPGRPIGSKDSYQRTRRTKNTNTETS